MPGYSQSLCGDPNFRSPIGDVVLVVVDVAVVWMKSPHNVLVASLRLPHHYGSGVWDKGPFFHKVQVVQVGI